LKNPITETYYQFINVKDTSKINHKSRGIKRKRYINIKYYLKKDIEGKNVWDGHPDGMLESLQPSFFPS
jgi:hypothetical protein